MYFCVQMADVKWQLARRVSPKREEVPIEGAVESSVVPQAERPSSVDITQEVCRLDVVVTMLPKCLVVATSEFTLPATYVLTDLHTQ